MQGCLPRLPKREKFIWKDSWEISYAEGERRDYEPEFVDLP